MLLPASGADFTNASREPRPHVGRRHGFSLVIEGIRANASSVGDGEDITAVVMVKGSAVGNPLKVADVTTGLAIKAKAAEGLQCETAETMQWLPSRSRKATRPGSCRDPGL